MVNGLIFANEYLKNNIYIIDINGKAIDKLDFTRLTDIV